MPDGVVGVLDRERGELRLAPLERRVVELGQVVVQHRARPAVGRDVVHDVEEDVVVRAEPDQERAQHRVDAQIERVLGLAVQEPLQLGVALALRQVAQVDELRSSTEPDGATICIGRSSTRSYVVRRISWRATRPSSACWRASASIGPCRRKAAGAL